MTDQARPRILFLAHLLPYPPDDGGRIKSYYTLQTLASEYDVTLLAFVRSREENQHIKTLRPMCQGGVHTVVLSHSALLNGIFAFLSLITGQSFVLLRDRAPAMQSAVNKRLKGQRFAAVHIDHLQMAQFVLPRKTGARLVLDEHNVENQLMKRMADTMKSKIKRAFLQQEWPKLEKFEKKANQLVDLTLTVTHEDASIIKALAANDITIAPIPIGVDAVYFHEVQRNPEPKTLLFVGTMSWLPNVDSVLWFYDTVYPLIKREVHDVKLMIVGKKPPIKVRGLARADSSVTVTGYVDDIRPMAEDCAAFIVPLLAGGGMRVKLVNALSMGLPIVSTRVGAEGIAVTEAQNILLANNPQKFAAACIELLRNPEMGNALGKAGRTLIEERYSWDAVSRKLLDCYEWLIAGDKPRPVFLSAAELASAMDIDPDSRLIIDAGERQHMDT